MSTDSVTAPAAGWYPDPTAASSGASLRWWSGTAWTEHTSAPAAPTPVSAPALVHVEDDVPDLTRFTRDPGSRPAAVEEPLVFQRDPYRDRNILGGLALVVALLSIPGTILSVFVELPNVVLYLIGGAPITFAVLGLVASFKLGFPTRMAWLAIAISIVTMGAGFAISAQQAAIDFPMPSVTDVPGVTEIQQLEHDSNLGG